MTILGMPERPRCDADVLHLSHHRRGLQLRFNHWPPTDNNAGRFGQGRYFGNPKKKAFYNLVECARIEYRLPLIPGWVVIEYQHVFRDLTHGDPSNFIKITQDALQNAQLIENDRRALSIILPPKYPWSFDPEGPAPAIGMTVKIEPLDPFLCPAERPKGWKWPWPDAVQSPR